MRAPPFLGPTVVEKRIPPVGLALLGALGALLLGWLGPLAYPFLLLTTLVHELGHGLTAIATGGSFVRFVVFADGSGQALTAGGMRLLIIPAGYVGVAVVGAALIMLGRNPRTSRMTLKLAGVSLALMTLRYALPTVLSAQFLGGLLTLVAGVGMGALLLIAAWRAGNALALWLLNLIAFHLGLSAFADLWMLFGASAAGAGQTDAASMAALTLIPAPLWAALWALTAAALLGAAVWWTWLRPGR
jgi:Peptidase M50B-like